MNKRYVLILVIIAAVAGGLIVWQSMQVTALPTVVTPTSNTATPKTAQPPTKVTKPSVPSKPTSSVPTDSRPKISSLTPASGHSLTEVTIHGTNFDTVGKNIITFGDTQGRHHLDGSADNQVMSEVSPDGKTLTFEVPNTGPGGILCTQENQCVAVSSLILTSGSYPVVILNKNGLSNTANFTLVR